MMMLNPAESLRFNLENRKCFLNLFARFNLGYVRLFAMLSLWKVSFIAIRFLKGCCGEQAKGWEGGLLADKTQGKGKRPKRIRKFRVDEKNVHDSLLSRCL
jgi:hypothetical protein